MFPDFIYSRCYASRRDISECSVPGHFVPGHYVSVHYVRSRHEGLGPADLPGGQAEE
jgi:hypothetical protein